MTRQEANLEILEDLVTVAKHHPYLRFHQLLWVVGIISEEDKFNEESEVTLNKLKTDRNYRLTIDELLK